MYDYSLAIALLDKEKDGAVIAQLRRKAAEYTGTEAANVETFISDYIKQLIEKDALQKRSA